MDARRPTYGPLMLLVTVVLLLVYAYGYVEQIGENNRSVSEYATSTTEAN